MVSTQSMTYAVDGITLYHGDNLPILASMEKHSIDAFVCDPPYGTASESKVHKQGSDTLATFNLAWDQELPLEWLIDAARILRPGGAMIAFTDNGAVSVLWKAMQAVGLRPLQTLYWHKTNPPPQPRRNFCSAVETAIFARKPGPIIWWGGGGATANIFDAPIVGGSERTQHPTQKPLALMAWLVDLVTPPGGIVCDPFAGSGTTLVAAKMVGCQAVGIERERMYFDDAVNRLRQQVLPTERILTPMATQLGFDE